MAMSGSKNFTFGNLVLMAPMLAVLAIWTVFFIEVRFGINLNEFGVYPRKFSGLKGVFFSPFIHGSVEHLYNNTIPIAVLLASLFYFYRDVAIRVLLIGLLLSGLMTWCIGRPSYHIGASGMIYVLASFIFFKGIFTKHYRLIALSLTVVFIYGGLLWFIFPVKDGISWEGHLSGFLSGLFLASILKTKLPEEKKYPWQEDGYDEEEDEFMKHFDEEGNFIAHTDETADSDQNSPKITYHYKRKGDDPTYPNR